MSAEQPTVKSLLKERKNSLEGRFNTQLSEVLGRQWSAGEDNLRMKNSSGRVMHPKVNNHATEILGEMGSWTAIDGFTPSLMTTKSENGQVVGYLMAQFDDASGEFDIKEYSLDHEVVGQLGFAKRSEDRRGRQYDTLTITIPATGDELRYQKTVTYDYIDFGGFR